MTPLAPSRLALLLRATLGLAGTGAVTVLCLSFEHINVTTTGFAFLLWVLAVATLWGFFESALASVASMLCYNYFFLPPVGRFTIAEPQNWAALFTFLLTALVASSLSNQAKRRAIEARLRQEETEQLYALSRSILLVESGQPIADQMAAHIARIFNSPRVALYDANSDTLALLGDLKPWEVEPHLKQATIQSQLATSPLPFPVHTISLGGQPIGALSLDAARLSDGALQALLNLVAIALERVRTQESASRAEVARRSEEFKSTLLDAISHEFKTPLTSIKAAATSMLGSGLEPLPHELATIIDEEADRLSQLVTEAARMSEIEAGKLRLDRKPTTLGELLARALAPLEPRLEERPLDLRCGDSSFPLTIDLDLLALALRQLLDNALKYSPPGRPIALEASADNGLVCIEVIDHGPGIPERDRLRVFDKFYRRQSARDSVPGSGLGLHIAREIVRAHSGELRAEATPGGGATLSVELPATPPGAQKTGTQKR